MNFDPVLLDDLAKIFVEAAVHALDKQIPAAVAGIRKNAPIGKGEWSHETIHAQTESLQATTS